MKEKMYIELDGKISLVTKKGRKVTREPLDGKVCLESILYVLGLGLKVYEAERKK